MLRVSSSTWKKVRLATSMRLHRMRLSNTAGQVASFRAAQLRYGSPDAKPLVDKNVRAHMASNQSPPRYSFSASTMMSAALKPGQLCPKKRGTV
jgi:hypothetical protein